jgi:hypothetical protein
LDYLLPSNLKCCVLGTLGKLGYCLEKGRPPFLPASSELPFFPDSLLFLRFIRLDVPDAVCEGAVRFDPSGGIEALDEEWRRWWEGSNTGLAELDERELERGLDSGATEMEDNDRLPVLLQRGGLRAATTLAEFAVQVDRTTRPKEPESMSTAQMGEKGVERGGWALSAPV